MILITTTHKEHFSLSVRQKETPPAMPKKSFAKEPEDTTSTQTNNTQNNTFPNPPKQEGPESLKKTQRQQQQQQQQPRRTIPRSYTLQKWRQMGFCTYFLSRILRNSSGLRLLLLLLVLKPAVHSFVKQTLRKGT
jgi:hypothetical protein